jgi:alkylation response protein AidB-like acyl-CoA dehydrogenase
MEFAFSQSQQDVAEVARRVFAGAPGWTQLGEAGLLGVGVPEALGGSGGGLLEACVVMEEQGRVGDGPPLLQTLLAGMTVAEAGRRPEGILTTEIDGFIPTDRSDGVVAARDGRLYVIRRPRLAPRTSTTGDTVWRMEWTDGEPLDGSAALLRARATVLVCAQHLGVAERALAMTAAYTSQRKQFDRPIATFQAVAHRAADAYIDVEAMRLTLWRAAWLLSEGRDARAAIAIAKIWACEAGHRVVLAAQHLHGGIGFDASYPLGRSYLWSKQLELTLGSAGHHLARLGALLRDG